MQAGGQSFVNLGAVSVLVIILIVVIAVAIVCLCGVGFLGTIIWKRRRRNQQHLYEDHNDFSIMRTSMVISGKETLERKEEIIL